MALVLSRLGEDNMFTFLLMTSTIMIKRPLWKWAKARNVALLETHEWINRTREQETMTDNGHGVGVQEYDRKWGMFFKPDLLICKMMYIFQSPNDQNFSLAQ